MRKSHVTIFEKSCDFACWETNSESLNRIAGLIPMLSKRKVKTMSAMLPMHEDRATDKQNKENKGEVACGCSAFGASVGFIAGCLGGPVGAVIGGVAGMAVGVAVGSVLEAVLSEENGSKSAH